MSTAANTAASLAVATPLYGYYQDGFSAGAGQRELSEFNGSTAEWVFALATLGLTGIVTAVDGTMMHIHEDRWLVPAEYIVLMLVVAATLVDAMIDLRRFATADALVTVWLRQFCIRALFLVKVVRMLHDAVGVWGWVCIPGTDLALALLGVSSSSLVTPPVGTAAKPPLLGVVIMLLVCIDSLPMGGNPSYMPWLTVLVRAVWGVLHHRRDKDAAAKASEESDGLGAKEMRQIREKAGSETHPGVRSASPKLRADKV